VVLVLGAWNYPFNVTIGPALSALAAGNCVVVKPSELSPASAKVMERIFGRLDQQGVRCVTGGPEVSAALTSQPFDHMIYTGGPRVAKLVLAAAAPNLTPVTLELGGKSPVIITEGVNLAEACQRIVSHKFFNTGQTCIAPDYVLVERGVSAQVADLLVSSARKIFTGGPETVEHFGRMVHAGAAERLLGALAEDHGGEVIFGGGKPTGEVREGHRYVPPSIIMEPRKSSRLMEEELFGPVLPILTVQDANEAIAYVNSKPKPLALYVFAPPSIENQVIERTSSGGVVAGDAVVHKGNPNLPFGGIGNSGMGRLHGVFGFRELSNQRAVMHRPLFPPCPIKLPIDKKVASILWLYVTNRPSRAIPEALRKVLRIRAFRVLALLAAVLWTRSRLRRRF
jgi:aldehyde dehydrogenase (NAD+)